MRLLGFIFAPRIRDLGETKLYSPKRSRGEPAYDALKPLIGENKEPNEAIRGGSMPRADAVGIPAL